MATTRGSQSAAGGSRSGSGSTSKAASSKASGSGGGDDDQIAAMRDLITVLAAQNEVLQARVESLAESVSLSTGLDAIGQGMVDIIEELAPLRELVPPRTADPLPDEVADALATLREAMDAPTWEGVERLAPPQLEFGYIGQARPAQVGVGAAAKGA
ncbi:hypothetical protein ACFVAJ_03665 [Agromyces sp. NPDC057679]|uniref:hypothetical protein n=1 Tax=Agromyces sp. NPDC057679 TaxID=3346207 RepID=UPI00366E3F53